MTSPQRTEQQVLQELSPEERRLLKRVLEIERSKMHLSASVPTDEILASVKEIIP
ncbi:hypothetical protein [Prescottella equi]|uniref:hypothetical protein n=1 Tax=Rhodococcus hoagii TaxID=43767 RepID=UPI0019DF96D7|nr:hypothetical protein [Prescottella equi]MBM4694357.1 hypothetical protein [Prescottella equi]NKT42209.1 hypothetical protein [Prescottella equi]